ncbi:CBL-interacting protein kinase 23 [Porphyridium purpureum]|uniref:non-specific serine/threonine protein kinase n=1 Tax=Porphyridium purpureum TaxID=35688 RepID=A0A5J4YP41_PORPP|nr:CBL-interacting protein kinase 23 [Porphyridium purpureum]|eukprot:POR7047..scf296_7
MSASGGEESADVAADAAASLSGGRAPSGPFSLRIAPYTLYETIGKGAFGKVKRATRDDCSAEFAVKIVNKEQVHASGMVKHVKQEMVIMKQLRHPNIVAYEGVLSSPTRLYLVMELVRGSSLDKIIPPGSFLSEAVARSYFQQLVDGLYYCHKRGVYHRDIKPQNLLVASRTNQLKILDFGVSAIRAKREEAKLTHTECGSPFFCAPEVTALARKQGGRGYDAEKADTWSCGVVLYFVLTGVVPFEHTDQKELAHMIQFKEPAYPEHLSEGALHLLQHMLLKDPAQRYSLAEVRRHSWFRVDYAPIRGYTKLARLNPHEKRNKVLSDTHSNIYDLTDDAEDAHVTGTVQLGPRARSTRHIDSDQHDIAARRQRGSSGPADVASSSQETGGDGAGNQAGRSLADALAGMAIKRPQQRESKVTTDRGARSSNPY